MRLTQDRYWEDFQPGERIQHQRARTITATDTQLYTLLSLNTAQAHFNRQYVETFFEGVYPERLVPGPLVMAFALGLASEDVTENAVEDGGYEAVRNPAPLFPGDTLSARSEILAVEEASDRPDAGWIVYRVEGLNQRGEVVVTVQHRVLVKKRRAWRERDEQYGPPQPVVFPAANPFQSGGGR